MWRGLDPELLRQLSTIRQLVTLRFQSPTREWPLIFVHEHDALFVIREWPDGSMTSYTTSEYSDQIRKKRR